jgi:hypothetical protein
MPLSASPGKRLDRLDQVRKGLIHRWQLRSPTAIIARVTDSESPSRAIATLAPAAILPPLPWEPGASLYADRPEGRKRRTGKTFETENEAKAFALQVLARGLAVRAGTLNPHLPKRTISSCDAKTWAQSE